MPKDPNATPAKGIFAVALATSPWLRELIHAAGGSMNWRYVGAATITFDEKGGGWIECTIVTEDDGQNVHKRQLRLDLSDHPMLQERS